jgi:hypothetical protein
LLRLGIDAKFTITNLKNKKSVRFVSYTSLTSKNDLPIENRTIFIAGDQR